MRLPDWIARLRARRVFNLPIQLPDSPITRLPDSRSIDAERAAAATCRRGVRVLDRKAAAADRVDEVHFGAVQIPDTDGIDEQLDAVRFVDLIARALPVLFDHQPVLEAGTTAALHEHSQAAARLVFLGQQFVDFRRGRFRDIDHVLLLTGDFFCPGDTTLYHWRFMAFVALDPATRDSRLRAARRRWDALVEERPDLLPAVALQRQLIGLVVDLAETIEHGRLPRLSLPPKYLAAKLTRGIPALTAEPIPLPVNVLKPTLLRLCEELSAGGAGEAADRIHASIVETRLDAGSLLSASLARDQNAIRTGASHRGLAADLVWLVAELAVSPFVYALQRSLLTPSTDAVLADALGAWRHDHCPACGSWPAIAEVAASHRVLRCSFCAYAWELPTYACIYCGDGGEKFVTAAPVEERLDRRLEVCGACGSYLKTVDVPELSPFPLIAIADLETMDLDVAAMERGYSRPPLRDFTHKPDKRIG